MTRGRFLIRGSSAIRWFFAGFLRCDSRTIRKSFLKKIACDISGNFVRILCKFPVDSRAISFRNDFIIVQSPQKSCEKPAYCRVASDEKTTPEVTMQIYLTIILTRLSKISGVIVVDPQSCMSMKTSQQGDNTCMPICVLSNSRVGVKYSACTWYLYLSTYLSVLDVLEYLAYGDVKVLVLVLVLDQKVLDTHK